MAEDKKRPTRDILIFGQKRSGKSSIINILQDKPVEQASDLAVKSTERHRIHKDGHSYNFWNTHDLKESVPVKPHDAVRDFQSNVDDISIDLLIYCIRDGLVDMTRVNYELVWRGVYKEKVPIVLVVTGLKRKSNNDEWWHENEMKIEEMKMKFGGHICIPSWDDRELAEGLWNLVRAHFCPRRHVILFGEAGAGKSSIVNMIVGKDVARVSSSPNGCTFQNDAYDTIIGDKRYVLYDTAGLNEGDQGRVPHWQAIRALYTLIRRLDGVSLLVYCMRGRILGSAKTNWNLFNKVICGEKVPIIAIVTGLDNKNPDELLKDNSDVFKKYKMVPKDVGCVASIRGKQNEFADAYAKSQVNVRSLVAKHCLKETWSEEKEKWFASIYSEVYESGLCFTSRNRLDYSKEMKKIFDEFVRDEEMTPDDKDKLHATLLKAESKFHQKKGFFSGLF